MTRLVCWQPLLTDHQRPTLDALGAIIGSRPEYIVAGKTQVERDRQGWGENWREVDAEVTELPSTGWRRWAQEHFDQNRDTIHIFGSPFGNRRLIGVLALALWSGARVWLISEPWSETGDGYYDDQAQWRDRIRTVLRPYVYHGYGRLIRRRVAGVFAISPLAVAQYVAIGVPMDRIRPFGYFIPAPAAALPVAARPCSDQLRAVFVGTVIARKGIAELAAAAAALDARGVQITVDVFGPSNRPFDYPGLRYRGMIPFGEAPGIIANYDVLIAPSRHDGWGVVVNEAIMAGVPVVASDRTGAGAMIDRWRCGVRFRAGDAGDLATTLTTLASNPHALTAMRRAARALAPELTPARAASYMAAALFDQPEKNPWYDVSTSAVPAAA